MTNIIGRKNRRLLIVCLLAVIASLTLSIGLAGFTRARAEEIEPVAIWTLATESVDYTVSQHTMKEICGVTGSDLQTDAMLWRQDTSASSDTSTNLIYSPSTAMKAAGALYAIHFSGNADKVIGTDINTVIVRIYAHLTADGSSYSIENGGIRLYAPDDTGENDSGYMIPADIPQNQWTNLVISGDDFAKLADKNGCFSGFTAGNATINNLLGNNGYGFADTNCWIAFDTFTAYSEHCVIFDDGASTTSQLVAAGETVTAPSVEKMDIVYSVGTIRLAKRSIFRSRLQSRSNLPQSGSRIVACSTGWRLKVRIMRVIQIFLTEKYRKFTVRLWT